MPSQLLAECMEQFELYGFEPKFQSYLLNKKSRLLGSDDVACDLVALVARENGSSGNASQLLSLLLDEARMGLESEHEYAEDFLEAVEMAVKAGLAAGTVKQENLVQFAGMYRRLGLPVPQSFMLDPDSISPSPNFENFDLSENLEKLARDVIAEGGSAYDLFSAIDTMLAAVPEEVQASLANYIAIMDGPLFERCALYMLLSGSEPVQKAAIKGLFERLNSTTLSTETMTFFPMIRGWFPSGPVQAALDRLIKQALRKAVPMQGNTANSEIQGIFASVTDGAGAQGITVLLKQCQRTMLAMIVIKAGKGIKDAFLAPPENGYDAGHLIAQLHAEIGTDSISGNTLCVLLEGALADGLENGCLPAPGFLDVVDACNLFNLRPQRLDLETLLNLADPERKIQDAAAQAVGRWINDDNALGRLAYLSDSWFEDSEQVRKIVAIGRTARSIESKIWKLLETRRDLWARRFLQTAVMLRDSERLREWKTLTASAYGLMRERPLKRIPLMEDIVHATIATPGEDGL